MRLTIVASASSNTVRLEEVRRTKIRGGMLLALMRDGRRYMFPLDGIAYAEEQPDEAK